MPRIDLETLGVHIRRKRGEQGVRAAAKQIGISSATLSRVERGFFPDLVTFRKICLWLEINPSDVLGISEKPKDKATAGLEVHFKKKRETSRETAQALADMILAADRALALQEQADE